MASPVLKLDFVDPWSAAFPADRGDFMPIFPTIFDPLADNHFIFGTDDPDMIDRRNPDDATLNMQRMINLAITTAGTGVANATDLVFSGGGGGGATAKIYSTAGVPYGIVLTSPGVGYTSAPAVTCPSGTGCVVTATLGAAPTIGASSLTIAAGASGGHNGLILPSRDSADETLVAVVRALTTGASNQVVLGALGNPSPPFTQGSGMINQVGAGYKVLTRTGTTAAKAIPAGVADGDWMFVALGHGSSGNERIVAYGNAGELLTYSDTAAKNIGTNGMQHAIGNAYYESASWYAGIEVAEVAYVDGLLTTDDLQAFYDRCRVRQTARGNAVY